MVLIIFVNFILSKGINQMQTSELMLFEKYCNGSLNKKIVYPEGKQRPEDC